MTYTFAPDANAVEASPQSLHLAAAELHEKAFKLHRQALLLHEAGDACEADMHGSLAYHQALKAAEASGRALKVTRC